MKLPIRIDESRHIRNGDFAMQVLDDELLVPVELQDVLQRLKVRTVNQLISKLRSFPSAFMAELDWDASKFEHARDDVFETLKGHVDPKLLRERRRFRRGRGALPPQRKHERSGSAS